MPESGLLGGVLRQLEEPGPGVAQHLGLRQPRQPARLSSSPARAGLVGRGAVTSRIPRVRPRAVRSPSQRLAKGIPTLSNSLFAVTFDCADAAALARFWADVLGRQVSEGATSERAVLLPGDSDGDGSGPRITFNQVPEPKTVKN